MDGLRTSINSVLEAYCMLSASYSNRTRHLRLKPMIRKSGRFWDRFAGLCEKVQELLIFGIVNWQLIGEEFEMLVVTMECRQDCSYTTSSGCSSRL